MCWPDACQDATACDLLSSSQLWPGMRQVCSVCVGWCSTHAESSAFGRSLSPSADQAQHQTNMQLPDEHRGRRTAADILCQKLRGLRSSAPETAREKASRPSKPAAAQPTAHQGGEAARMVCSLTPAVSRYPAALPLEPRACPLLSWHAGLQQAACYRCKQAGTLHSLAGAGAWLECF